MAIVEGLERRKLHISRNVVHELLKIHKALMERLTKWTYLNCFLSSVRKGHTFSFSSLS